MVRRCGGPQLGDRNRLILLLDDLQWGDVDSAHLFKELLQPRDPPVMLVLGTYRAEDEERSECLRQLGVTDRAAASAFRIISLTALTHDESIELALNVLDRGDASGLAVAEQIVAESRGSPYFLSELAHHVRDGALRQPAAQASAAAESTSATAEATRDAASDGGDLRIRLDDALWRRIETLPANARSVLELLSVASRPLRLTDTLAAASIEDSHGALARLRNDRLLRATGPGADETLAPYHDRIRETCVTRLAPDALKARHRSLVGALVAGGADAQTLAIHHEGAGELEPAGRFYLAAADEAAKALAFEQAANLYRKSLALRPTSGAERRDVITRLAEALSSAGRGLEAAEQFLAASMLADPDEMLVLKSKAGFNYCSAGDIDSGRQALAGVLDKLGMPLPKSRVGAIVSLLWNRLRLLVRGSKFKERPDSELTQFHTQHFTALSAHTYVELYRGQTATAWDSMLAHWPGVRGAFLLLVEIVRIYMYHLRASVAIAAAEELRLSGNHSATIRGGGRDWSGALLWNPATLSGLDRSELEIGAELLFPHTELSSFISASAFGPGVPPIDLSGSTENEDAVFPLPTLALSYRPEGSSMTFGLGMFAVAGFGLNYRGDSSNPLLGPPPPAGLGFGPIFSEYQAFQIAPAVAMEVCDGLSISIGPLIDIAMAKLDPLVIAAPDDANGDTFATYPNGTHSSSVWGGGFSLGAYYDAGCWRFGASYKSKQWFEDFSFQTTNELGVARNPSFELNLPAIVSVGTSYVGIENVVLAADVRYLDFDNAEGFGDSGFNADGSLRGIGLESIFAVSLGAQAQITDRLSARLGYSWSENPIADRLSSANVASPLIIEHMLSIGATYEVTDALSVSLAYMHAFENSIDGPLVLPAGAVPGTSVKNEASIDMLILGVTVKFGCPQSTCGTGGDSTRSVPLASAASR